MKPYRAGLEAGLWGDVLVSSACGCPGEAPPRDPRAERGKTPLPGPGSQWSMARPQGRHRSCCHRSVGAGREGLWRDLAGLARLQTH